MKLMKPVLWTGLGVIIGVTAVVSTSRVRAQQTPVAERIEIRPADGVSAGTSFGVFFVKDNKSGGCWVATKESGVINTIAVAPPRACDY